jgi:hypothetical protein
MLVTFCIGLQTFYLVLGFILLMYKRNYFLNRDAKKKDVESINVVFFVCLIKRIYLTSSAQNKLHYIFSIIFSHYCNSVQFLYCRHMFN